MIIAIDTNNEDLAGAIVYWRLSGGVNGDDLNNALKDAGLDEYTVRMPSSRVALRRAMTELTSPDIFLRAGRAGDHSTYLVRQVAGEDGPEFRTWLEGRLGVGSVPEFEAHDLTFDPDNPNECPPPTAANERAEHLTQRFWHHVFHVSASDISSWLIDQAAACDALSLRDSGGVYFIPRHAINRWRTRADCLHAGTTCRVYMIPAMHSDDAVDAVMQSLIDECTSFTNTLQRDLEAEELGKLALETRAARAKSLLQKLDRYEKLLGKSLDDVRGQIEEQQTNAIAAALVAGGA